MSRNRKPDIDPLLVQMQDMLANDGRSKFALSNVSGLSTSTISNWQNSRVKRPQSVSLQMMAKALGYSMKLVKD